MANFANGTRKGVEGLEIGIAPNIRRNIFSEGEGGTAMDAENRKTFTTWKTVGAPPLFSTPRGNASNLFRKIPIAPHAFANTNVTQWNIRGYIVNLRAR